MEDAIFKERQERELGFRAREKAKKARTQMHMFGGRGPRAQPKGQFAPTPIGSQPAAPNNVRKEAAEMRVAGMKGGHVGAGNNSVHGALSKMDNSEALKAMMVGREGEQRGEKRNIDQVEDDEPPDEVRLWEDGFKDRYYESKFDVGSDDIEFRYRVAAEYTLGFCWVLRYYYQGCSSWKWYFPYHYAPFASDFVNIGDVKNEFETGTRPFKPLEQLMSVFPAASRSHVPEPWGELMIDPHGPIIDFYPIDFKIDLNGKKYAWQGVALLPFVMEERLHAALESVYPLLTPQEIARNVRGDDRMFVREGHKGFPQLKAIWMAREREKEQKMEAGLFDGVTGKVMWSGDCTEL